MSARRMMALGVALILILSYSAPVGAVAADSEPGGKDVVPAIEMLSSLGVMVGWEASSGRKTCCEEGSWRP